MNERKEIIEERKKSEQKSKAKRKSKKENIEVLEFGYRKIMESMRNKSFPDIVFEPDIVF